MRRSEKRQKGIYSRARALGFGVVLAFAGLIAFLPNPVHSGAQQAAQQNRPSGVFLLHTQRSEVLVDVRVSDESGKPLTDLKQSDFKVFEDGTPQEINSFSLEDVARLATASAESGPPPTIDLSKLPPNSEPAKILGDVPGRKSVIHFSSGIERTGEENEAQLRSTTDTANRSNVSIYTMDSRGLVALPPGGDATTASPAGTAVYTGSAVRSQFSSLHSGRETLAALAADTGGKTFYDLNEFSTAFQEVQRENSSYYLLGYSPSNTKSDGRFRRIHVEVDRSGVTVQARPGYYAPKDFRQFTREDKEVQLDQAMSLDTPFVDLPMAIEASYFRQPDRKYYVVLAAKIPGSAISFLNKSKAHETEFDFAWRATDAAGHTAAALRDTLPVKLTGEDYERVLNGNILYEGGIVLPPGKFNLKVVVRENESGKLGTFEQPLTLPDFSDSVLSLSSVVVSNQMEKGKSNLRFSRSAEDNPLRIGARGIFPSVTRVFRTNQNLYVYLESYAAKPAANSSEQNSSLSDSPPAIALVFFRGGEKVSEVGPIAGKSIKSPEGKVQYFVKIPLAKFPPGRYGMQANVLDPAFNRATFTRIPIAVLNPPARAGLI